MRAMDAGILAGRINAIPLFEGDRPGYKAILPVYGKPLLWWEGRDRP